MGREANTLILDGLKIVRWSTANLEKEINKSGLTVMDIARARGRSSSSIRNLLGNYTFVQRNPRLSLLREIGSILEIKWSATTRHQETYELKGSTVRNWIDQSDTNVERFASKIKISRQALCNHMDGKHEGTIDLLKKLSNGMKVNLYI